MRPLPLLLLGIAAIALAGCAEPNVPAEVQGEYECDPGEAPVDPGVDTTSPLVCVREDNATSSNATT